MDDQPARARCSAARPCRRRRRRSPAPPCRDRPRARRPSHCCRRARGSGGRTAPRPSARRSSPCGSSRWPRRSARASSDTSASPIAAPPMTICARPSGASGPKRSRARSKIFIVASAESGVFSDGFQMTGSPQTSASAAFHDQTATGKLKAEMIAHGPMRMPGLGHPVAGPLGGDREAVHLPREAHGEIADVDHLLHFAEALGDDLADLERHQRAERLLRGAQFLAKQADELAPPGRRDLAPGEEGLVRALDDRRHVGGRRLSQARDLGAVDRRADGERAARKRRGRQTQALENVLAGHGTGSSFAYRCVQRGPCGEASLRPQFRPPGNPAAKSQLPR